MKILIVDDEQHIREALTRTLRKDFEVIESGSAKEALDLLKELHGKDPNTSSIPQIILADEKMPERSGADLLREIKILYPSIVRVLISGQIQLEEMMAIINESIVHRFILKPWDNSILRLQLQEALLQHRSLDEISKLQKLAVTDSVTGLTNHRFFQESLREELDRAIRYKRELSLLMIDVDHFKKFNDSYGHPAGDKALAQIARLLKKATRVSDRVSRYGGEEFAVILPETTKAVAADVAERIRTEFESISISVASDQNYSFTLSMGLATFPLDANGPEKLIEAADQALYQAKTAGRNRVKLFKS